MEPVARFNLRGRCKNDAQCRVVFVVRNYRGKVSDIYFSECLASHVICEIGSNRNKGEKKES